MCEFSPSELVNEPVKFDFIHCYIMTAFRLTMVDGLSLEAEKFLHTATARLAQRPPENVSYVSGDAAVK